MIAPGSTSGSVLVARAPGQQPRDAGGGRHPAAKPQPGGGGDHPPPDGQEDQRLVLVSPVAPAMDDRREHGARPSEEQHRHAKEVREPHTTSAASTSLKPGTPSTTTSARSTIARGPSFERTPTQTAASSSPSLDERLEGVEGVQVGHVVTTVEGGAHVVGAPRGASPPAPCRSARVGGSPAPCGPSGCRSRRSRASWRHVLQPLLGRGVVGHVAPVEGLDRPLVLDPDPQELEVAVLLALLHEVAHPALPAHEGFEELRAARIPARAARPRGSPRRRCRPRPRGGAPPWPSAPRRTRRCRSCGRACSAAPRRPRARASPPGGSRSARACRRCRRRWPPAAGRR